MFKFNKKKSNLEITSANENRNKAELKKKNDEMKNDEILNSLVNKYYNIERKKLINDINKAALNGRTELHFNIDNYFNAEIINDESINLIYSKIKKEFEAKGYKLSSNTNRPITRFVIKW